MKSYLLIFVFSIILSSCYKQSIPDAMLNKTGTQNENTATMSYEINGKLITIKSKHTDQQSAGFSNLYCQKSAGYIISGRGDEGELVFHFFTDSLEVDNYRYPSSFGPRYFTNFEGRPQYVYGPTDYMEFNISSYKDGYISGNFSGQLTPVITAGYPDNVYGATGSVLIKNGSFNNVPVFY